ncbi:hypothetical protein ZIOFF_002031 [Zingiber officinale]|uniref:KHA domain-containing protein n=1 Tax=Zingiber officinale TaxID=94328 RepID=A0A8J5I6T2_ZINOF|nr:hypothetical protein ZIOFF_002031 [Zingiber officinale]
MPQAAEEEFQSSSRDHGTEKAESATGAHFHNSLFGVISAANVGARRHNQGGLLSPLFGGIPRPLLPDEGGSMRSACLPPPRVTISCPDRSETVKRKLVLLPNSLRELLDVGSKTFGFEARKVLTEDGAEIDDVRLIRDGDRLVLSGEGQTRIEN